jgi:hypothetical protein
MDWLEEELKQALARKEPSPDFDSRVTAATRRPRKVIAMTHRWMAAAAALVILAGAGEGYRWRRGQVAKDQVMLAMRIAGGKLNHVQMQVAGGRP